MIQNGEVMSHEGIMIDLPQYPDTRELLLEDRELFTQLFQQLQPRISELTFAGLYLFRNAHAYRISLLGDAVIISGRGYDGAGYLIPPLSGDRRVAAMQLLGEGWELYGVDEAFLADLAAGVTLRAIEDRDNFDYLHRRNDLAQLSGNRLHKKRNRVNYFMRRHAYRVERYRDEYREGCLKLLDDWLRAHDEPPGDSLLRECEATREGLALAATLGLEGVVVVVAETVKGFALGERLNAETSVCHFQKADPFLDGVFQLVDQEFNRLLFTDCQFVNREQDLGVPSLRHAKLSYQPVELVKKFRVRIDNSRH